MSEGFFNRVLRVLAELDIPYAVVGAYAATAFGEPRFTADIDVLVELNRDQIPALAAAFPLEEGFYADREQMSHALDHHIGFNILDANTGLKADIVPLAPGDPLGRLTLQNRVRIADEAAGGEIWLARPEEIIIGKLQAYAEGRSDKHLRDIRGILVVLKLQLDLAHIAGWARLLKMEETWDALLAAARRHVTE